MNFPTYCFCRQIKIFKSS